MLVALGNCRLCFKNVTLGVCESVFFFMEVCKHVAGNCGTIITAGY